MENTRLHPDSRPWIHWAGQWRAATQTPTGSFMLVMPEMSRGHMGVIITNRRFNERITQGTAMLLPEGETPC